MMEHLAFVIWLVGYPLTSSVGRFLYYKGMEMTDKQYPSDAVVALADFVQFVFYIWIAIKLY